MTGWVAPSHSRCSLGVTGSGTIGADREPGDAQASAAIRSETPGFLAEVPGPSPIRLRGGPPWPKTSLMKKRRSMRIWPDAPAWSPAACSRSEA